MSNDHEPGYNWIKEIVDSEGNQELGIMSSGTWIRDPKRLTFVLSRYKFVSRIFFGFDNVLELGSADGWPSRIVRQSVSNLTCVDFDSTLLENGKKVANPAWPIRFQKQNIIEKFKHNRDYDGIFALDVLEHIHPDQEHLLMENIISNLIPDGICIIGVPSLESQIYSYPDNGHINCKSGDELRKFCSRYFRRVIIFSMNDEVVHTGFEKMAQYFFALCTYPIKQG